MKPIYHQYTKWEDYQNGMFSPYDKSKEGKLILCAIKVLCNPVYFDSILKKVYDNWIYAKEENLSNKSSNRQSWLGQAACCYEYGVPEVLTRKAWVKLNNKERYLANKVADKYINGYEAENKRIHKNMGGEMLF